MHFRENPPPNNPAFFSVSTVCIRTDRQVCLNSVDPDETAESSVSTASTLFYTNPAFFRHNFKT